MPTRALTSLRLRLAAHRGKLAGGLAVAGAMLLLLYPYGGAKDAHGTQASRTFELRGTFLQPGSDFVADPLLEAADTPLVVTSVSGGRTEARVVVGHRVTLVQRLSLPAGAGEHSLARWAGDRVAVALLRHDGRGVRVSVAAIDGGRRLADERVAAPPAAGAVEVARLGPWAGRPAALFMLVWPHRALRPGERATGVLPLPRLEIVGSGARGRLQLAVPLPLGGSRPGDWDMQVSRVSGAVPDLVLIRRAGSEQPEVHVLSGESGFRQFIFHAKLDLAAGLARRAAFVPALDEGKPALFVVERAAGRARVRVFPLASAAPTA